MSDLVIVEVDGATTITGRPSARPPTARSNHVSDAFINVRPVDRPSALNPPDPLSRRPTSGSRVLRSSMLTEARQIGRGSALAGVVLVDGRRFVTISLISGVAWSGVVAKYRLAAGYWYGAPSSNLLISRRRAWTRTGTRQQIRFVVGPARQ